MRSNSDGIRLAGRTTAPAGPGSIDLARYPTLTHAPHQWGHGVRLARNGVPVDRLLVHTSVEVARRTLEDAAVDSGCSIEELFDAVRYARDHRIP